MAKKRKKLCKNSIWPMLIGSKCPDCGHHAALHPAENGDVCGACEIEDVISRFNRRMRKR